MSLVPERKVLAQDLAQYNEGRRSKRISKKKPEKKAEKKPEKKPKGMTKWEKRAYERNATAERLLTSATREIDKRIVAWQYKDTDYIKARYGNLAPRYNPNSSGGANNRNASVYQNHFIYGGDFNQIKQKIEKDYQREKSVRNRQSAGLRVTGNAQIKASQTKELARLDGGKKISSSISTASRIQAKATQGTVAEKSQKNFESGFTPQTKQQGFLGSQDYGGVQDARTFAADKAKKAAQKQPKETNVDRFAAIATAGTSLKTRASTIPVSDRGSYIGYSPDNKAIQGPPAPRTFKITPLTSYALLPLLQASTQTQQDESLTPINISQFAKKEDGTNFTSDGNQFWEGVLKSIDETGRWIEKKGENTTDERVKFASSLYSGLYAQGAGIVNFVHDVDDYAKQNFGDDKNKRPDYGKNRTPLYIPQTITGEFIGGTVENIDLKEGAKRAQSYWQTLTPAEKAGEILAEAIPFAVTGGIGMGQKVLGIGSKTIKLQTATAQTVGGKAVKESIPVAKEFRVFQRPVLSKVYTNPSTVKVTTKGDNVIVKTVDTTGKYKLGKTDASQVLQRSKFEPQGRGFEVYTGDKATTRFNLDVMKQLNKEGKLSTNSIEKIKEGKEAVDIVKKHGISKAQQSAGKKPIQKLTQEQSEAVMAGFRVFQSPSNLFKGRPRGGAIGGSFSEQITLKQKFTKQQVHDLDTDVGSVSQGQRGAKIIQKKLEPLQTKDTKFELSSGKGTKVERVTKDGRDEFAEFLDPKTDKLKYQSDAQTAGKRFGYKYRSDSASSMFKRPIKDPVHGVKVRDPKDQFMAKMSSVISVQGGKTEKFTGNTIGVWEKTQNILTDQGKLRVAATAIRGKDEVGAYRHMKSQAELMMAQGKTKQAKRLNEIADNFKRRNPNLNYDENIYTPTTQLPNETTSSIGVFGRTVSSNRPPISSVSVLTSSRPHPNSSLFTGSTRPKSPSTASPSTSSKGLSPTSKSGSSKSKSVGSNTKSIRVNPKSNRVLSPTSKSGSSKSPTSKSPTSKSPTSKSPAPVVLLPNTPGNAAPFRTNKRIPGGLILKTRSRKDDAPKDEFESHNFLGNTRTDHIVGLFKRSTIIHGDRKIRRQEKKDRQYNGKPKNISLFNKSKKGKKSKLF